MVNIFKNIAVVAVLTGTIYLLHQQYKEASALDNLITQHIQQADVTSLAHNLAKVRARQEHEQLPLAEQALLQMDQHLKAGEHLDVLAKGNLILETDPGNLDVLLRMGLVYLKEQDYDLAEEQLLAIHEAPVKTRLRMEAAWYLALLQSQKREWQESQTYLKEVIKTSTRYHHLAEELLAQIKRQL